MFTEHMVGHETSSSQPPEEAVGLAGVLEQAAFPEQGQCPPTSAAPRAHRHLFGSSSVHGGPRPSPRELSYGHEKACQNEPSGCEGATETCSVDGCQGRSFHKGVENWGRVTPWLNYPLQKSLGQDPLEPPELDPGPLGFCSGFIILIFQIVQVKHFSSTSHHWAQWSVCPLWDPCPH